MFVQVAIDKFLALYLEKYPLCMLRIFILLRCFILSVATLAALQEFNLTLALVVHTPYFQNAVLLEFDALYPSLFFP